MRIARQSDGCITEMLQRSGFVVLSDFLVEADIRAIDSEIPCILERMLSLSIAPAVREQSDFSLTIKGIDRVSDRLFDFARQREMLAFAEAALGCKCIPLYINYVEKLPFTNTNSLPRQDHALYKDHFDVGAVDFRIALDDNLRVRSGRSEYADILPSELLPHHPSGSLNAGFMLSDVANFTFRAVNLRRGDCVAHHSLAVHRQEANLTAVRSRAVTLSYRASPYREWLGNSAATP